MKENAFDKVMATLSDQLNVAQIMVTELDYCTRNDDPSRILGVMDTKNYDIMPVKEDDRFIGYIERSLLEKMKQIGLAMQVIKFDIIVSSNTSIDKVINLFQKSRFFFVNRANDLVGLVTYADLDKIPVRIWLFILISKFEILLLQLIKKFYKKSLWLNELTPLRRRKITDLLNEKRKHDIDVSLEDCLNLGDLIELLERDGGLRSFVGYETRNSCSQEMSGLDHLRNNVVHPSNSLVNSYDGVKKLNERIGRLQQAMKRVESALENPITG